MIDSAIGHTDLRLKLLLKTHYKNEFWARSQIQLESHLNVRD